MKRPDALSWKLPVSIVVSIGLCYLIGSYWFGSIRPSHWFALRAGNIVLLAGGHAVSINQSMGGGPLSVGGEIFERGLGTIASSEIVLYMPHREGVINGACGVDDKTRERASVICSVFAKNKLLVRSPKLYPGDKPYSFSLAVKDTSQVLLVADNASSSKAEVYANWLDLELEAGAHRAVF